MTTFLDRGVNGRGLSALEAIALSERENRIVHLAHSHVLANDLFANCDGDVDANGIHEYWGEDWRVHLHRSQPRKVARSGYTQCLCRDCFDVAISSDTTVFALCSACADAGCDGGECQRPDAYGSDGDQ